MSPLQSNILAGNTILFKIRPPFHATGQHFTNSGIVETFSAITKLLRWLITSVSSLSSKDAGFGFLAKFKSFWSEVLGLFTWFGLRGLVPICTVELSELQTSRLFICSVSASSFTHSSFVFEKLSLVN